MNWINIARRLFEGRWRWTINVNNSLRDNMSVHAAPELAKAHWVMVSHAQTFPGLTRSQLSQWQIYVSHSNATITCWYLLSHCQIVQQTDLQQSWPSLVWPRGKRWELLGICLAPSGSIQHMPQCHSCIRQYIDRYGTVYSRRNNFWLKGVVLMSMLTWWPDAFRCESFSL